MHSPDSDEFVIPAPPVGRRPMAIPTRNQRSRGETVSIVPLPRAVKKARGTTIRLPIRLWEQLEEILRLEARVQSESGATSVFKLNDLMRHFVKWSIHEYWVENGPKPINEKDLGVRALMIIAKREAEEAARLKANAAFAVVEDDDLEDDLEDES